MHGKHCIVIDWFMREGKKVIVNYYPHCQERNLYIQLHLADDDNFISFLLIQLQNTIKICLLIYQYSCLISDITTANYKSSHYNQDML